MCDDRLNRWWHGGSIFSLFFFFERRALYLDGFDADFMLHAQHNCLCCISDIYREKKTLNDFYLSPLAMEEYLINLQ